MRFLNVPKGMGFWSTIYLILGSILLLCGLSTMGLSNIFSAVGIMQLTGAKIILNTANFWFPFLPTIIDGGRVGLAFGLILGISSTIIGSLVWISPREAHQQGESTTVDKKEIFVLFCLGLIGYDLLSTYYCMNGGTWLNFGEYTNWLQMGGNVLLNTFIIFLFSGFVTIGSQMMVIFSVELIIYNFSQGIIIFGNLFNSFKVNAVKLLHPDFYDSNPNYRSQPHRNEGYAGGGNNGGVNIRRNEKPSSYRPTFQQPEYVKPDIHEDDEREVILPDDEIDSIINNAQPIKKSRGRPRKEGNNG